MSERTKIRLAKSEGFLFDTRTGYKVLEFGYNESGEQLNEVDADQIMQSVNKDVPRNVNSSVDLDLARSAPETTASPSETAADKGILTEEELKVIEDRYGFGPDATFSKVFDSHKALFAANAELSFKNQKYKQRLMEIMNAQFNTNDSVLAVIDLKSLAYKALEELK